MHGTARTRKRIRAGRTRSPEVVLCELATRLSMQACDGEMHMQRIIPSQPSSQNRSHLSRCWSQLSLALWPAGALRFAGLRSDPQACDLNRVHVRHARILSPDMPQKKATYRWPQDLPPWLFLTHLSTPAPASECKNVQTAANSFVALQARTGCWELLPDTALHVQRPGVIQRGKVLAQA